ncbi:acyltransferase [Mycobacterium sp. KBS0706]|uniref:acyltransferase n=1 Tax=Mycobacterium sp. KBS0706 TaxID=2578109 RepID=UPI00117CFE44|nr:acyltransferase [Mycobacterium sp. KBS0706]TSD85634.1 acyltransferase [Mycobacterium sp. KBS0706]
MKRAIRALLRSAPARLLVRCLMVVGRASSSLASAAKTATLFPRSEDCFCHWSAEVKNPSYISLGRGVIIGPRCTIGAASAIHLGDHVHLSKGVYVETAGLDFSAAAPYPHVHKPIAIGEGVWVGADAIVLGGVTIGDRAVIGAGAVVSRDVPPDTIVTGQPTRQRPR